MYLVESGAKLYVKAFNIGVPWHKFFNMDVRKEVARQYANDWWNEMFASSQMEEK